jgi:peptidoglycan/xylan/chitin deacetylase (PgdA/CDA1 family)
LPEALESNEFIITFAKSGDTPESLAARYLGSPARRWMIEDYADTQSFTNGQAVVIPKRDWNPPGVHPSGYQLVPVLVYHNIAAQRKGRLVIAASVFEEQMRYLKREGYRAVRLEDFLAHVRHARQLPKKSVLLTFDDGHKGFLEYAYPLLKELGFPAVLFMQTAQISGRPNPSFLSWPELRDLVMDGVEVQAHSKTHRHLKRAAGETDGNYARRMQSELGHPLDLLRKQLPRPRHGLETIAHPYGEWDEDLLRYVKQYGYTAGFTVRRQANPAFVALLKVNRSQVFSDWTLDDFRKNLNTFQDRIGLPETASRSDRPTDRAACPLRRANPLRERLAAPHNEGRQPESLGSLRQALDECKVALTINPADGVAQERRRRLENRIETKVALLMNEGLKLARRSPAEAGRHFLGALALDPMSQAAFEALQNAAPAVRSLTHTVRLKDTIASLADLYYGDRSRGEIIEQANGLQPGALLAPGRQLEIPEIPGVPFLRPDR